VPSTSEVVCKDYQNMAKKKIDPATIPPFCDNYDPHPQGQEHRQKIYEEGASKYWNRFYSLYKSSFFKDRHWILREFNELHGKDEKKVVVLDLGCGVGNTLFPLLEKLPPNYFFYACDFSSKAVKLLQENSLYDANRVTSFVCDLAHQEITVILPEGASFALLIFVLSAISPNDYDAVVSKIFKVCFFLLLLDSLRLLLLRALFLSVTMGEET